MTESIDFQQAAWVQISHLVVQNPTYAGFIIRRASHHITIVDSLVSGGPLGINIGEAAGTGHVILRNRIEDVRNHGIVIDGVVADSADPTVIRYNTIIRSGQHGMEISGSNYTIERNQISRSGQLTGGTSGIHLFRSGPAATPVSGNLIRYNYSYSNADATESDGNGIQIDQWCDGNTVAFNVVWGNDGAGVAVFDGNNNQIYANTARDNGRDPARSHGALGEIIVSGSGLSGRPSGNSVYDNVVIATRAAVPSMYVDTRAVMQASNAIGPNLMFNTAAGPNLRWTDSSLYDSAAQIDTATGVVGNIVLLPAFAETAAPLTDGLRMTGYPGRQGVVLTGQLDLLGRVGLASWSYFGAYFTAP